MKASRYFLIVLLIISFPLFAAVTWPIQTLNSPVFYTQHWYRTALGKQYLKSVYGKHYSRIDAQQITYFYPSFQ